jgi:hypothetical protein
MADNERMLTTNGLRAMAGVDERKVQRMVRLGEIVPAGEHRGRPLFDVAEAHAALAVTERKKVHPLPPYEVWVAHAARLHAYRHRPPVGRAANKRRRSHEAHVARLERFSNDSRPLSPEREHLAALVIADIEGGYRLPPGTIRGALRAEAHVQARQMACCVLANMGWGVQDISRAVLRHHTSVIYAVNKGHDDDFLDEVENVEYRVRQALHREGGGR